MSSMVTLRSGTFLSAAPTYSIAPAGPGGNLRGHPVVTQKPRREIPPAYMQVLPVHQFLKMIADVSFITACDIPVLGFLISDCPAAVAIRSPLLQADAA